MFYVNSRAIIERTIQDTKEILIQTRVKPPEPLTYELPGGRVEAYQTIKGPVNSVGFYFRCKAALSFALIFGLQAELYGNVRNRKKHSGNVG